MSGDILVVTAMGVLLVSNVEKTEIMLNILQCAGQLLYNSLHLASVLPSYETLIY